MPSAPLLAAVTGLVPAMQERAGESDRTGSFPAEDIAALRRAGALAAPLPIALGGLGAGTEPHGAPTILALLTTIGSGALAVGRLFEAHVNALRLIVRDGSPGQLERAARDVHDGRLFGLWVTDPPGRGLTLADGQLHGEKGPCSGASHCTRAVVTVATEAGTRMAVLPLSGAEQVHIMRGALPGMRAACNGVVGFDCDLPPDALLGQAEAYMTEPDFSCGAWRTSAVTLGGLSALVAATRAQLVGKNHHTAPLQQARFGDMLIAAETASLWVAAAAHRAETEDGAIQDRIAYVNLARLAVERATLSAITLAQRSLGLAAFLHPNPVERICRDLSVYLRQPAPDAVLLEAAQHGFSLP